MTNKVEKTDGNLTKKMAALQDSVDRVQRLCEWYSNWSCKHETLLDHGYVARCELVLPLKKFLANQDNPDSATDLETKLNSFRIVKVDRATRFPNHGIYVNIKNDHIRFYIEELKKALAKRNNLGIRQNVNAFVSILSKVESFRKYDIHNFASFESAYELKWTVS
ncbi:hypothetical protein O0L34_g14457 [Tuta absoluta]|nr:hypothetical protein O0L34_g14457 [Tuta absoluta]